jgi:hypothetical protein
VVGASVGDPDDLFDCNGFAVASVEGRNLCTDVCDPDNDICPYGMRCEVVACECAQEFNNQCFAFLCGENQVSDDNIPVCVPENGFTATCTTDVDCQRGDYCGPDGACRVEDRPVDGNDGCGVCDVCESDADCLGRGRCLGTNRGQQPGVCLWTCDDVDVCPGNSECQLYTNTDRGFSINVCVAPGDHGDEPTFQEMCADYDCVTSCRDDVACPDGFRCNQGSCEAVVVGDVTPPATQLSVRGAGLASTCGAGGAAHVVVMAMLLLRRRRR